jgi:hypothetical protein
MVVLKHSLVNTLTGNSTFISGSSNTSLVNLTMHNLTVANVEFSSQEDYPLVPLPFLKEITVVYSSFENITTSNKCNGTVFFVKNITSAFQFSHNVFRNITGHGAGGACYFVVWAMDDGVRLNNISFYSCSTNNSQYGGGALFIGNVAVNLTSILFSSCFAQGRGGAVFVEGTAKYLFENITFALCSAQSYVSNDVYFTSEIAGTNLVGSFIDVCTDVKENGINYGPRNYTLDSLYSSNECDMVTDCGSINTQALCVTRAQCYYSSAEGVCATDVCLNISTTECSDYENCIVYEEECVYGDCEPDVDGSCNFPCISEEDRCVVDVCSKYTAVSCLSQTVDICKLVEVGEKNVCLQDVATSLCQNLTRDEGECNRDRLCFWNRDIPTVLRCDTVVMRDRCVDARTEKECALARECNEKMCHCEYSNGRCRLMNNESEENKFKFPTIWVLTIGGGVVLLIIVLVVLVIVIRRSSKERNRLKMADLYAHIYDDDGEVDIFYSNRSDFVK